MDVLLAGKRIRLDPSKSIGKGGEADVYLVDGTRALKIFKPPTHGDLVGLPQEQEAARQRIAEQQEKLRAFPTNLPPRVVVPETLATNLSGSQIVGYAMKFLAGSEVLLKYADKTFRQAVSPNDIPAIFTDLHMTVERLHQAGSVIGDFNNLNVLIKGPEAFVIDSDSFQFGRFLSRAYTERYLDPLLANAKSGHLSLTKPYQPTSDWYAYSVMLLECLLFVGPYGGVYIPKKVGNRLTPNERVFKRMTVFHPDVRYPKPALPYSLLPDELMEIFRRTFEQDRREIFPKHLIENLRWTKCSACHTEHAKATCPNCKFANAAVKTTIRVRGTVVAEKMFQTPGAILNAAVQNRELKWLYHEDNRFKREKGQTVLVNPLEKGLKTRLQQDDTLIARASELLQIRPDGQTTRRFTDTYLAEPVFDANADHTYWTVNGQLMRNGVLGAETVGETLAGQTQFWVGAKFGIGFYRAGELWTTFVFGNQTRGINDSVKLPRIGGQLVDADCTFSDQLAWLMFESRENGQIQHYCFAINARGEMVAQTKTRPDQTTWASQIHGHCALGNFLLSPTDEGIVKTEIQGSSFIVTKQFPDTEPFCDSSSTLLPGSGGLYVVGKQDILMLKIT